MEPTTQVPDDLVVGVRSPSNGAVRINTPATSHGQLTRRGLQAPLVALISPKIV